MSGPLSGSMLYQYIERSPSAMCCHLSFPYHERGKLLSVVDSAGAPGWPMCSWSQVDVLQQCRQNPGLLCYDCFQAERYVLPASLWYRKSILGYWYCFGTQKQERRPRGCWKEEYLSSYSPNLFLFCFYPGLIPLLFIQELIFINWWYSSLIASHVLHINVPGCS